MLQPGGTATVEARPGSQNCLCFAGLEMGSQIGHFHKHVHTTLQGPYKTLLAGFRGLPRPSEASLMGFRGLPRPCEASTKSQNPFSLQDNEASGGLSSLQRRKGRSWLQVPWRLESQGVGSEQRRCLSAKLRRPGT